MKRLATLSLRMIAACVPLAAILASSVPLRAQAPAAQRVLGREDITLYGLGLKVEPGYQTVPKNIATIVSTFLQAPALPAGLPPFAPDAEVAATLRGPSFQAPLELRVKPNTPFNIPAMAVPGAHVLENIRLISGGEVLLRATPGHVTIDVIEKLLVTQVTARALTAAEVREHGIVFDPSNFQAYNFSAAFAISDQPVHLSFPVLLPRLDPVTDSGTSTSTIPAIPAASLPTLATIIPDTLKLQTQIPNLSVVGFTLKVPALNGQSFVVPPIPGVVVIPGDIGFLNQYFSVLLMVGNVAPSGSNLVVTNLKAEIVLPPDSNGVANSPYVPLAMAKTAFGESPRLQAVAQPGSDGKVGTADDIPTLGPGESGNAEYLVEGRREGSHVVEMHITGTLNGLPVGPVGITGRAAGAVLVRNPNFTLTFTHPEVVTAGEPYTLDVTVSNTSTAPANFVSVNLYPRNVSGATIVGDASRTVETIAPGDAATLTFNLIAKKSGKVTAATLDSDDNVAGRFSLKAAVGELGVPLSPDSLVLPKEANGLRLPGDNPDDLKQAALGLLGKAHAVATAPPAALPSDVRRFSKKIVIDRAIQVAEAGLRASMGEPLPTSASQLLMDFMGSDVSRLASLYPKPADQAFEQGNFEGFDELRRKSVRGDQFAAAVGRTNAPALAAKGAQQFHHDLAQAWTYRPGHVSILVSGNGQPLPASFSLTDAQNRRVGTPAAGGKIVKEIPFSDVVDFTNGSGATIARLLVLAAPQAGAFQIAAAAGPGAPANAGYTVSVVSPLADGSLRQVTTPVLTFPQRPATIGGTGDPFIFTFAETGGEVISATTATAIVDPGPTVLAVFQQAHADVLRCDPEDPGVPAGRVVAVLFSEEVTPASVQDRLAAADITNFAIDGNRVVGVALQPGRRIAFLALRDPFGPFVTRTITISNVKDVRGNGMLPWIGTMQATVGIDGGVVSGRVLNADGTPVPFANVRLFALLTCGVEPRWVGISSRPADASGKYQFDYVTKLPERILAVNLETGELRNVRFNVQRDGQRLNVDIVFLGRGTFTGTTFDERGRPLPGTAVRVSSLTDGSQYGATTDAAGRFTIPGVPVGNFFVETVNVAAHAEFSFSEYMPGASATVTRDITLLDVATRDVTVKFGALSGHVLRADGITPVAGVPVIVWYQHLSQPGVSCPGVPASPECAIAMMTSDGQGRFSFPKLTAGELRVHTFDQGAFAQGQARVVLAADAAVETNVVLASGLGTVQGIVLDAANNPVAGARVGGGLSLTTTAADGRFTLTDVPVGRYPIVAVSDALGSRGETTVDIVQAGQVVNATITLAPVGAVTGLVVQADGLTPVPNVDVYVFKRDTGGIAVVGTVKTTASGGFSIPSVPAGAYYVSAFNAGFTDGNIVPASIKFQGQTFRTTIRFRGAGGKIVGKVLDDDGVTPLKARVAVSGDQLVIAGGRVGVEFQRVNYFRVVDTDFTTGAFTFNNLFVGPVTVSAIGQFSPDPIAVDTVIPAPNATVTVELKLQATSQIKGVVLLPNGVQPAGANVVVKYKSDAFKVICSSGAGEDTCESIPQGIQDETVVTDAQGRFWLPVVNAGTFTLTVEDPVSGKVGTIQGNVKPGEIANLSVRLFGRGEVTVNVLGSNGTTPIAGAQVEVEQLGYPQKRFTFTADGTGTVLLTGGDALAEGGFVVKATDPANGFSGRARGRVAADGEQVLVKVFLFNAAGTVSGKVFALNGYTPVANAEVIVGGAQGPLAYTVTGADGQYSVGTVPVGPVSVEIFEARTGRRGAASGSVDADGQQVTINVIEAAIGMVKGQVLHQATLDPLKGWTVSLTQQSPTGLVLPQLQTTTGIDGAYSFPGASRGTFALAATNRDVAAAGTARGAIEREGQVVEIPVLVNIVRQLTGGITGTVVSAGGAPVGNAALEFCLPNRCGENPLLLTAGADGTFVVNDVPLGRFSVVAKAQASGDTGSAVGEIAFDGDVAVVTVVMSGLARVTGQVVRADGSPAANVQVALTAYPTSGCAKECNQSTDGSGGFTFINIPGRTFTVTATDTATGLKGVAGGSLNPGEQKTVHIVLGPATTVTGRVMTSSGQPAHGAVAELILDPNGAAERRLYRETGPDGIFDFAAVPFGAYRLVLTDPVGPGIATRQGTIAGPLALGDVVLDEAPPQVATLAPAAASRGVALSSNVTITFTEPIQPGTINAENVVLLGPNGPVLATLDVTTNDTVVVLNPIAELKDETVYTVRINNVKDRVQKSMPAPYAASFTTLDVTRPTVVESSPATSASGVAIYTPVRIKFSEAIDTAKFAGAPITVTGPAGPVAGQTAFLFGNTVLVFTPNVPLAEDATYQVAVKKATDLSGLEQAVALTYAFKTTSRIPPTLADLVAANNGKVIEGGIGRVTAMPSPTSDVLFVDFYVNGVLSGTDRLSPFEFAFQATPQLGAPGASVTVTAIPTDTSGNRGVVPRNVQLTIVADQPPAVTLGVTTPTGTLTAKNGDRITVAVQAADDVGVKQLGYRAATGNPADALTRFYMPAVTDKSESFAFHIPAAAAPGATIAVQASAIDTKGQVVQAAPVDVVVIDAVAPVVQITGATTGATLRPGQSTTVLVTADDLGGIANVTFVAGGLVVSTDSRTIAPPQNAVVTSFTVTVPATAKPGQTLTLDALATDRTGNVGTAARVILPIADTLAPTAALHTSTGSLGVAPGQAVSIIVDGEDEGLVSELRLSGAGAMTFSDAKQVTPASGSASRTFELMVPETIAIGAQIQLTARAVDLSGNVSAPATLTLTAVSTVTVTLPASQIVKAGKTADVTVQLGQPAGANGLRIDLSIDDSALATAPAFVTFAEGETSRTFQVTGIAGGTTTLRALYQSVERASMTIAVSGGNVIGTVFDSRLNPVAGAQLTVSGGGVSQSVISAADGTYAAEGIPGPYVTVKALDPVTRLRGYTTGTMSAASGSISLSVVLIPAAAVEGTVFHADGTTPAGPNVRVDILESTGTLATVFTDAQGRYAFPLVTLGKYTVRATATDGNRGSAALTLVESGQEVTLPIIYLGHGVLTVTVKSGAGAPVPNAALALRTWDVFGANAPILTNADATGRFTFDQVPVGSFSLEARDQGTGQAGSITGTIVSHQQALSRDVVIASFGSIHGTVFRPDGSTTVAGARVTADGRLTTTNESGQYRFDILPLGNYTIRVSEEGTRGVGSTSAAIAFNGQDVAANVTLMPQGRLLVTVRDANGAVVPNAFIEAQLAGGGFGDTILATAAGDGTALIEHVLAGTATIRATSGALAGVTSVPVPPGALVEVTVTLEATGQITGTVYEPDGQTPVTGGAVRLNLMRAVPIGTDGVYKADLLPKGPYSLEVYDSSSRLRALSTIPVQIDSNGQVVTRDFTLVGIARVTGKVVFSDGRPAQAFGVTLRSLNPDFGSLTGTTTDAGGNYVFENVPVGAFMVTSGNADQQLLGEATGAITQHAADATADIILTNNAVTLPQTLYDGNAYPFVVRRDGQLGTNSAFGAPGSTDGSAGGASILEIVANGVAQPFQGEAISTVEDAQREFATRETNLHGLTVTRKIAVPRDGYFSRALELLTNPGTAPITVDVRVATRLRPDGGSLPIVLSTSSGDATFAAGPDADAWVTFRDGRNASGQVVVPGRALVVGTGGAMPLGIAGVVDGSPADAIYGWTSVTVQPGQTVGLLHFTVQQTSGEAAQAAAERLAQLPPEALHGLSLEEIGQIANFTMPAGGHSTIAPLPPMSGTINGRVFDGDTPPTATPSARVFLESSSVLYRRTFNVIADTDGRFSFTTVTADGGKRLIPQVPYTLHAQYPRTGAMSPSVTGEFLEGSAISVTDVVFSSTGVITGVVRRANGDAVQSGTVRISGGSFEPFTVGIGDGARYRIAGIPAGSYTLTVSVPAAQGGTNLTTTAEVTVVAGTTTQMDITLPQTFSITGTVLRASNAGAPGVTVSLAIAGSNVFTRSVVTSTGGAFAFLDVQPGSYTVTAAEPQTEIKSSAAATITDAPVTLNLTLIAVGSVTGKITLTTGVPAVNRQVALRYTLASGVKGVLGTQTNGSGDYAFTGVPASTFTLEVNDTANNLYGTAEGRLQADGENVKIDFALTVNTINLPATLYDANGFQFTLNREAGITNNGVFASEASVLQINTGSAIVRMTGQNVGVRELGSRQIRFTGTAGPFAVTRKVYVPSRGYFSRYIETFHNPTSEPLTLEFYVADTLRSNWGTPFVHTTSSGDTVVSPAGDDATRDRWAIFDDYPDNDPFGDTSQIPAVASVWAGGAGIASAPGALSFTTPQFGLAGFSKRWSGITLQPGEKFSVMHFVVMQTSRAAALAAVERLAQLPDEAIEGLTDEDRATIRNFVLPPAGGSTLPPLPALDGKVQGHVYGAVGTTPVSNAAVRLTSGHPLFSRTFQATTASDGAFSFTGSFANPNAPVAVAIADYTLHVSTATNVTATATGSFAENETVSTTDVRLTQSGSLTGILRRSNGVAVAGVLVADNFGREVTTAADGRYTFETYRPGPVTLNSLLYPSDGQFGSNLVTARSYTIVAGQTLESDLTFPAAGTLQGTITRTGGVPASGVTVSAYGPAAFSRWTITDAQGRYRLDDLLAGAYQVQALEPRTQRPTTASVTIANSATTTQDLTVIAVGSATVTVKLANAQPAVSAWVWLDPSNTQNWQWAGATDTNGVMTIADIAAGTFGVRVAHPMNSDLYAYGQGTVTEEGQHVPVAITLPPTGTVTGVARTPKGLPMAFAPVYLFTAQPDKAIESLNADGQGNFTFTGVPLNQAMHLTIYHPMNFDLRRDGQVFTLTADGETHREDIVRAATARVVVTATRPDGTKWNGLTVYARDSVKVFYRLIGTTDANGVLTLFGVPEGAFSLQFFDPGAGILLHETQGAVTPADDEGVVNLPVQFTAARGVVTGTIYAADGSTPAPDATVEIFNVDDGKYVARTSSDANGGYAFSNMIFGQGGFRVRAASRFNAGLAGTSTGTIAGDGQSVVVDVTVPAVLGSISGKVTTPDGVAIQAAAIYLLEPNATEVYVGPTSVTGEYQIANYLAPPAGFAVVARIGGVRAQADAAFTAQRDNVTVNLVLGVRRVAIPVRVLGGDAATAVQSANVAVYTPEGAYLAGGSTNASGLATAGPVWVPLAGVRIDVDYRGETRTSIAVPSFDPAIPIDVVLPMSVVKGRVLFADLSATNRPNAFIEGADGVARQAVNTTTDGEYVVFGTTVGPFKLTGQDRLSNIRTTVDGEIVSIATAVTRDVVLPPTGTVQGTLFDDKGVPMPQQLVELSSDALAFTRWAQSDANGLFQFVNVPAGVVAVYAAPYTQTGRLFMNTAGTVAAGTTLTLDLHPVPTATVTGTLVDASGLPYTSASVQIEAFGGASPSAYYQDWADVNENGAFTFNRVPVGPIKLTASTWDGTQGAVRYLQWTPTTPPVTLTLGSGVPLSHALTGDNGFVFSVTSTGSVRQGAPAAVPASDWPFDYTYEASTNDDYFCCADIAGLSLDGRHLTFGPLAQDALLQTRKVFVPQSGAFVRFLEILENPLAVPVKATVQMWSPLRPSASRTKVAVSPGDTGNTYLVLDDTFGGRTPTAPAVAHVAGGTGAVAAKTVFTWAPKSGESNYAEYQWTVTVPPNGKVAIMHFGVARQPNDTPGAQAQAFSLVNLTDPEALAGMTDAEKAAVKNFIIPAPGGGGQ